jgi:thioredoxin reductase (NADPH)
MLIESSCDVCSIAALEAERLLAEEEEADPVDLAAANHYTGTDKV